MKFRFLGGEDCPEWLGAEIATVAKISSVRIRILAKKIVQLCCLGDSGRELGKAEVEHTPFKTTYQEKKGKREVQQAGFADEERFDITWG